MAGTKRRDDLLQGPKEKAIEAIKAGKTEEAIKQVQELSKEFKPLHDRYSEWIQYLLTFIAEKLGEPAVEEALKGTYQNVYQSVLPPTDLPVIDRVKGICKGHRTHYSDFYIEEDDEKFVVNIKFCGSGGRIQQKNTNNGRTKKPYPWSDNMAGMAYYCCHEPIFLKKEMDAGISLVKEANQFDEKGQSTGKMCQYIFYKNPKSRAMK